MKKILIINAHPLAGSFSDAIVEHFVAGINSENQQVKTVCLRDLNFDPILHGGYRNPTELEPDLRMAQDYISWSDHIVWIFPIWWGEMPALLKGFIDRTFLPGFAFRYKKDSPMWDRLLKGRTTSIITTMDAPVWYHRWIMGGHGIRSMNKFILRFCGLKLNRVTYFGSMRFSTDEQRKIMLEKVSRLASK